MVSDALAERLEDDEQEIDGDAQTCRRILCGRCQT